MNADGRSLAEKYDGERFQEVEKFVKTWTPASGSYMLKDGSRVARVNGLVEFLDHGIHIRRKLDLDN